MVDGEKLDAVLNSPAFVVFVGIGYSRFECLRNFYYNYGNHRLVYYLHPCFP